MSAVSNTMPWELPTLLIVLTIRNTMFYKRHLVKGEKWSRHALVGAEIARRVLREVECDLTTREENAVLARFHGRPP
jgi:hypothetical protein